MKLTIAAAVKAPWLITNGSAAKNAKARIISRIPAQLIGSTDRPNSARISEIAPTVPGKM